MFRSKNPRRTKNISSCLFSNISGCFLMVPALGSQDSSCLHPSGELHYKLLCKVRSDFRSENVAQIVAWMDLEILPECRQHSLRTQSFSGLLFLPLYRLHGWSVYIHSEIPCFCSRLFSVILPPASLISFLVFISASCILLCTFGIKNIATQARTTLKIKPRLCHTKRECKTNQESSRLS